MLVQPLECGVVADFLALSVERLASLLVQLERRGLIETCAQGLHLTDIAALESLAGRTLIAAPKFEVKRGRMIGFLQQQSQGGARCLLPASS